MHVRNLIVALWASAVILLAATATATPIAGLSSPRCEVPPPVIEDPQLYGQWQVVSITYRDETEDVPPGATILTFDSEGNARKYQNGELVDEGSYAIQPQQRIRIWSGRDKVAEEARYRIENGTLTILFEIEPGYDLAIVLRTVAPAETE